MRTEGYIVCIGGAAVDRKYYALAPLRPGTSNPAVSERSFGGVARNVAESLARLGAPTSLVSIVGDDENGRAIIDHLRKVGIDTSLVAVVPEYATAEYVAVLQPDGDLAFGLADMGIFDASTTGLLDDARSALAQAAWLFADCNLPTEVLHDLIARRSRHAFRLAIDAVSTAKILRLPHDLRGIDLLFLNRDEAQAYLGQGPDEPIADHTMAAALVARGAAQVVLTLGASGLVAADASGATAIPAVAARVLDATGAGDALIAATLVALMRGAPFIQATRLGTCAAALTIESRTSVRPDLSPQLLESAMQRVETATQCENSDG